MASTVDRAKHKCNKELYDALMRGEEEEVIQLCRKIPEGPFHILSIHNDTILHMATNSKQEDLVLKLLKECPHNRLEKLTLQNDIGNTILHEAATSDRIVPAAMEMLLKAPQLLRMQNERGETALFRAARYGKNRMFKFLDGEINKIVKSDADYRTFHVRDDKTTILHISILAEHFDLALLIARKYEYLVGEGDGDGMTGLQLLACNPSAFRSGSKLRSLKQFIDSCVSTEDTAVTEGVSTEDTTVTGEETCCRVPLWEAIRKQKQQYESALKLAKFLIERDTSWEYTNSAMDQSKPKTHKFIGASTGPQDQQVREGQKDPASKEIGAVKSAKTPLFLATRFGCTEIVEEILGLYPQAIEHVDDEGCNILHVAIKYHQIQILEIVEKMEIPMRRLIRKIDNNGNSILHMVGIKAQDHGAKDLRSPALLLQEDLLLFERVMKISATHFIKHFNSDGKTAEKLFSENNDQLRLDAKEWIKGTAENSSIVAVLIATVAFAAAYTVPGGPNQNTGYPILQNQPFFVLFTMTDVLSLTFALTAVITYLSILTSPFRLKDFKKSLPQKLMLGVTLLIFSVSMMMLAFAATVILLIRNKEQWTKIALYSVAFFPVTIFALSYLPLYVSLMETFKYSLKKVGTAFPQCNSIQPHRSWIHKSQATILSKSTNSRASTSTSSTCPSTPQTTHFLV